MEGGEWPREENESLQGRRLGSGRASQAGEFPVAMDSGMPAGTKAGEGGRARQVGGGREGGRVRRGREGGREGREAGEGGHARQVGEGE